jgi:DNA-binding LytR/AlgR family response regulator
MRLRAVIADDEPLAVRRIEQALAAIADIEIVGAASTGRETLSLIGESRPDLVLLDIAMPELSGLDVVEALDPESPPAVIFVSAHDRFAVDAFREGAVDYLMKPLDSDRLRQAVDRARLMLRTRDAEQRIGELRAALEALRLQHGPPEAPAYERHLWVARRGATIRIAVDEVRWFGVEGDYVVLHVGESEHLIHDSLRSLETRLDPARYVRVHRNAIVRIDSVEAIERLRFGAFRLRLDDGTPVKVGRTYRDSVRRILAPAKA